jgi:hypothetical protein
MSTQPLRAAEKTKVTGSPPELGLEVKAKPVKFETDGMFDVMVSYGVGLLFVVIALAFGLALLWAREQFPKDFIRIGWISYGVPSLLAIMVFARPGRPKSITVVDGFITVQFVWGTKRKQPMHGLVDIRTGVSPCKWNITHLYWGSEYSGMGFFTGSCGAIPGNVQLLFEYTEDTYVPGRTAPKTKTFKRDIAFTLFEEDVECLIATCAKDKDVNESLRQQLIESWDLQDM